MSAHNLVAQMQGVDIGDGATEQYLGNPDTNGKVFAWGNTVPTDATAGYSPGCIFVHTDGGDATSAYLNEGTVTSCDFNALLAAA